MIMRSQNNSAGLHISVDPMYVKNGVKPSRIETLEVTIGIPLQFLYQQTMTISFQFKTAKNKFVGQQLFSYIDFRSLL